MSIVNPVVSFFPIFRNFDIHIEYIDNELEDGWIKIKNKWDDDKTDSFAGVIGDLRWTK